LLPRPHAQTGPIPPRHIVGTACERASNGDADNTAVSVHRANKLKTISHRKSGRKDIRRTRMPAAGLQAPRPQWNVAGQATPTAQVEAVERNHMAAHAEKCRLTRTQTMQTACIRVPARISVAFPYRAVKRAEKCPLFARHSDNTCRVGTGSAPRIVPSKPDAHSNNQSTPFRCRGKVLNGRPIVTAICATPAKLAAVRDCPRDERHPCVRVAKRALHRNLRLPSRFVIGSRIHASLNKGTSFLTPRR